MINRMLSSLRPSSPRDRRAPSVIGRPRPDRTGTGQSRAGLSMRLCAGVLSVLLLSGGAISGMIAPASAQTQPSPAPQPPPTPKPAAKQPAPAAKAEPAKPDAAKPAAESAAPAAAAAAAATPAESASGLPLPRFVSLRSDQVNMRAGPGARYPVDWVYMRRELPVEVIQEYETWRKIRDPDGAEGWVHQSMLTGRRTIMVRKDKAMLRRTADDTASAAAYLSQGVVGKLLQCPKGSDYCRVEVEGYQGWLRRNELWGAYKAEAIN